MLAPFHALALSLGLAAALSRRLQTRCWRFPRLGLVRSPLARGQRTRGRLPSCPLPSFPTPALSGVFPTNPRSIKLSRPDLPLPVTPRKHPVHGSIYSPVLYVPSRPSETAIRVRYTGRCSPRRRRYDVSRTGRYCYHSRHHPRGFEDKLILMFLSNKKVCHVGTPRHVHPFVEDASPVLTLCLSASHHAPLPKIIHYSIYCLSISHRPDQCHCI